MSAFKMQPPIFQEGNMNEASCVLRTHMYLVLQQEILLPGQPGIQDLCILDVIYLEALMSVARDLK
jgi:hypothetical protein